jgi:transposase
LKQFTLNESALTGLRDEAAARQDVLAFKRAAALLAVCRGRPVKQVAELIGVTRQSIYNWLESYGNGGADRGLADAPRSGRPPRMDNQLLAVIRRALSQGPRDFGYNRTTWSASLLGQHVESVCGCKVSGETIRRHLHKLGFAWNAGSYSTSAVDTPAGFPDCVNTPV